MTKFVHDNRLFLEVSALRWVKKSNVQSYIGNKEIEYWLEYSYRGSDGKTIYKVESERDEMFEKIIEAAKPARTSPKSQEDSAGQ